MTDDKIPLAELMAKADDGDFLRSVAESVLQILMEADVEGVIGASRYERSGERATYRNGYRDRGLDTRLGTLNLKIPKLRTGSYFPGFLEPRRTVEKALVSVIQEAWIAGVSTRQVKASRGHQLADPHVLVSKRRRRSRVIQRHVVASHNVSQRQRRTRDRRVVITVIDLVRRTEITVQLLRRNNQGAGCVLGRVVRIVERRHDGVASGARGFCSRPVVGDRHIGK